MLDLIFRVGIEPKNLAKIRLRRSSQSQPIILRFGMSLLMRVDVSFAEPLQPNASHEAFADLGAPVDIELLLVCINRWIRFQLQCPISLPIPEDPGSSTVYLIRIRIRRLGPIQLQTQKIEGGEAVEMILKLAVDHVVRWCNAIA
jgi:hypothetical protein